MLSIVYPYYNNPNMFAIQLLSWKSLSPEIKEEVEFIVVDDGSKEFPLVFEDVGDIKFTAYVIHDDILWNVGGAKNLGVTNSYGTHVLITDIDRQLTEQFLSRCIDLANESNKEYCVFGQINSDGTKRRGFHQGTVHVPRAWFWCAGGYDEDFSGNYGHEDGHLLKKLRKQGLKHRFVKDAKLVAFDKTSTVSDASTPDYLYGDRHVNGKLAKTKGDSSPIKLDVLRFSWSKIDRILS